MIETNVGGLVLSALLRLPEPEVGWAALEELRVRADGLNLSIFEDDDSIGVPEGREAVRDDKCRSADDKLVYRLLDQSLRLRPFG